MPRDAGHTVYAPNGMVCSVDHLASAAGVGILRAGGNAVDAAVATSAVLAVTTQHMCGMGGDLFALVHHGSSPPAALVAAGRAGCGADAAAMRAEGLATMPFRRDVRSATVPGCVDGWVALHGRHGRLPLADVLEPARGYAEGGFPASPLLALATLLIDGVAGADDFLPGRGLRTGDRVRRPLVSDTLAAIARDGRDAFYRGAFGDGLQALGDGLFSTDDLARPQAEWAEPLSVRAWGRELWTVPPPSQGYLALAAARVAATLDVPGDPDDPQWVHLLSEASRATGHDRIDVLFDGADGRALLAEDRLAARRALVDPRRRGPLAASAGGGDTIYLCTADRDGMGVSLIQSNAADWGCHLVVPRTGIFLHNRGIGFRLEPGHPAELTPGRRPPHTLSPTLVTRRNGSLGALVGTMGGDIQPQVVLQITARLLHGGQSPGRAVGAPRWALGTGGFATWEGDGPQATTLENDAPDAWERGLTDRGHRVVRADPGANLGHAHAIVVADGGMLAGASDPRALTGAACGY